LHIGDEEAGLAMLLGLLLKKLPQCILHEMAHVPKLEVTFEKLFGFFENFAVDCEGSDDLDHPALSLAYHARKYYIGLSPWWR
jgi:hypothetical protein